jgi:hypothetical protein
MGSSNHQNNSRRYSPLDLGSRVLQRTGRTLVRAGQLLAPKPRLTKLERELLARNRIFEDCHRGRRAFVIGTGPSLQGQDISSLGSDITYAMSAFWKHESTKNWQPTYYCLSDPIYFDGSEQMRAFFRSLTEHIYDSTFFIPTYGRPAVREQKLLPEDKTYWLLFAGELNTFTGPAIDFTEPIPAVWTISHLCLMAAIYMGCSPIYLIGLDHDWLSHRNEHQHFYQGQAGLESHPEVKPSLSAHSYRVTMEAVLIVWKGYEVLKELARRKGLTILNATNGGFLDVFDRVDYGDVINSHKR